MITILRLFAFSLSVLLSSLSLAQSIVPEQSTIEHNEAFRPCLTVVIEPEAGEVQKEWESFMKSNYKVKFNGAGFLGMGNLLESKAIVIPAISSKTLDFYANISQLEEGTELKVFVAFGYDVYVNPEETPAEFKALNHLLGNFIAGYLQPYYENKVSKTEKELKKLTKRGDKLEKKQVKYTNKIERLEQGIVDAKAELVENREERSEKKIVLEERQKQLDVILKQIANL